MARFAAGVLLAAVAFHASSLAWRTFSPPDPGCAVYEETAGKTDRVALSGAEAVEAMFEILTKTEDPEVRAGLGRLLEAASSGDSAAARAAQARVMEACGVAGLVRGYDDFEGQLADRLG
jgi:hypothetical protein